MNHRRRSLLTLFAALGAGAGCVDSPGSSGGPGGQTDQPTPTPGTPPAVSDDALAMLVDATSTFALDLHRELVSETPGENVFVSPYSIALALAMTWAGAEEETAAAMAETLHLDALGDDVHEVFEALVATLDADDTEEGAFQLRTANALWGQSGFPFDETFLDVLAAHYAARMHEVDFGGDTEAVRQQINDWVEARTEGKIEDLLPRGVLSAATRLVLTNAIYFKALWRAPFDESATEDRQFANLDGSTTTLPSMTQTESFPYAAVEGAQAIELPYRGGASMVVVVPDDGTFRSFERSLGGESLAALLEAFERAPGTVSLPAFTVESTFSLEDALSALGMEIAFDAARANFDGMVAGDEPSGLFIKDVIHKSFVAVDEKGTEAAAATAVVMDETAVVEEAFELVVDRPFFFFIRDQETGTILFSGRVVDGETAQG